MLPILQYLIRAVVAQVRYKHNIRIIPRGAIPSQLYFKSFAFLLAEVRKSLVEVRNFSREVRLFDAEVRNFQFEVRSLVNRAEMRL